ncbi:unnamed protein product [Strongylus vulgaris]|uniref:SHSP domain-containing protein n=1 Tax=Strongylus vulgaris TaxID=40348 RepID=A0A3P7IT09_STRVU|nr:unnamed protein product [Strongylus vulgaris]
MNHLMNEYMHDMDRSVFPYWRDADHSVLHVANDTQQTNFLELVQSIVFRSFIRKWTLPENVDLESVHTQLSDKGHLCVEAPKVDKEKPNRRHIPIMAASAKK